MFEPIAIANFSAKCSKIQHFFLFFHKTKHQVYLFDQFFPVCADADIKSKDTIFI